MKNNQATTAARLTNNTKLEEYCTDYVDECPQHGTPARKEYEYAGGQAARVHTYKGCGCAVAHQTDPAGLGSYAPRYFTSYNGANSLARLCVAEYRGKGWI
jgi:hypothetical protein